MSVILLEGTPVDALEEGVILDLLRAVDTEPICRDPAEQPSQEIFQLVRHGLRQLEGPLRDVGIECFYVLLVIRRNTNTELVEDSAQTIPVHVLSVAEPADNFRGQVGMRTQERVRAEIIGHIHL